jgi:hypothetical protein
MGSNPTLSAISYWYIKRILLFSSQFPQRIFGLEVSGDLFGDSAECRAQIALCFCIYALHANEIPRTDPLVQVDYACVVELDIGGEQKDNLRDQSGDYFN